MPSTGSARCRKETGSVEAYRAEGAANLPSASCESPSASTIFRREENPAVIRTAREGNPNSVARNSQSASLALPSVAGAWTLTFKSSPSQPTIPFREAPGTTLTEIFILVAPAERIAEAVVPTACRFFTDP